MVIELAELLLAIGLIFGFVQIVRKRVKLPDNNKKCDDPLLENLTFEQLQKRLIELEQEKKNVSFEFINQDQAQQKIIMAEAAKVNKKIEKIKAVMEEKYSGNKRWYKAL